MPPKPKFTKNEMVSAALKICIRDGLDGLTARSLSKELDSSTRPIFTIFNTMEEIAEEVKVKALETFSEYANKAKDYTPFFKGVGMQMVGFAKDYPKLYRIIFMCDSPSSTNFGDVFANLGDTAPLCVEHIKNDYALSDEKANHLFKQMWIYTYGLATLIATGMCNFSTEVISQMLTDEFTAILKEIKAKN